MNGTKTEMPSVLNDDQLESVVGGNRAPAQPRFYIDAGRVNNAAEVRPEFEFVEMVFSSL